MVARLLVATMFKLDLVKPVFDNHTVVLPDEA